MKIIDDGHKYELAHLDGDGTTVLTFVKRKGKKYPGNKSAYEGVTTQEVLRALIQRAAYVDSQKHSQHTRNAMEHMRMAMWELEVRAAKQHGREINFKLEEIHIADICPKCGHVGCNAGWTLEPCGTTR